MYQFASHAFRPRNVVHSVGTSLASSEPIVVWCRYADGTSVKIGIEVHMKSWSPAPIVLDVPSRLPSLARFHGRCGLILHPVLLSSSKQQAVCSGLPIHRAWGSERVTAVGDVDTGMALYRTGSHTGLTSWSFYFSEEFVPGLAVVTPTSKQNICCIMGVSPSSRALSKCLGC